MSEIYALLNPLGWWQSNKGRRCGRQKKNWKKLGSIFLTNQNLTSFSSRPIKIKAAHFVITFPPQPLRQGFRFATYLLLFCAALFHSLFLQNLSAKCRLKISTTPPKFQMTRATKSGNNSELCMFWPKYCNKALVHCWFTRGLSSLTFLACIDRRPVMIA